MIDNLLQALNLKDINSGSCYDQHGWSCSHNKILAAYNPADAQLIAKINLCSLEDYQQLSTKSHQAFLQWRTLPAPKRGELIQQLAMQLRRYKDLLGSLISLETGKSKVEGDGEVQEMIDMADFAVGQSRMLYGKTMHSERANHRMYEQWHPLGVVGIITAFNFPMAVWSWNAFLAVIAGNTVIWKPSSKTPLCAIAIQHICNHVMAENGYSAIFSFFLPEDRAISTFFVNDRRIPLISFTGSTATGRFINEQVSQRLGRCLLEMSGNNAVIIDKNADLKLAIPAIVFGAIGTAGQRCTSTRRLFIHTDQYAAVLQELLHAYRQITIGDPLTGHIMGPLIDQAAVDQFVLAVKTATERGGEIIFGGHHLDRAGYYVEPTIICANNDWDIVQQETFAPILYLMKFTQLSAAIDMQNAVAQGLSSAIFTNDLRHAEYFLSTQGSDCGIANVNMGTSGAEIGGAFGGEKATGGGREAGSDAWKTYMRRQTTTINWGHELPLAQGIKFNPPKPAPYSPLPLGEVDT